MTLAELVTYVRMNFRRTDKDDYIRQAVNWGLKRLTRDYDFPEMIRRHTAYTEYGIPYVEMPDDIMRLLTIRCDKRLISKIIPTQMEGLQFNKKTIRIGRPLYYSLNASESGKRAIELYPVPNKSYDIDFLYFGSPAPLVEDTDRPPIEDIDDVLVASATSEAFLNMQMYEDASVWNSIYRAKLAQYTKSRNNDGDWTPGFRNQGGVSSADPQGDPFTRRWN